MTARELIEALQQLPQDMEVCVWDDDWDDYRPVRTALYEDGCTNIELLPFEVNE